MNHLHFSAETIAEALEKVRRELGEDACIVQIRHLKRGGVKGREAVEVTAVPPAETAPESGARRKGGVKRGGTSGGAKEGAKPRAGIAENSVGGLYTRPSERDIVEALARESAAPLRGASTRVGGVRSGTHPRCLAFLGPTGSGKTTMAAKLAYAVQSTRSHTAGLVSADYCGFCGVTVLESYANAIACSFRTAFTGEELRTSVDELAGTCGLVIIDTPGINHNSPHERTRLQGLFSLVPGVEKHLVLPVTGSRAAMLSWLSTFSGVGLDGLAVTRLDEIDDVEALLKTLDVFDVPVSFLSRSRRIAGEFEFVGGGRLEGLKTGVETIERQNSEVA